jgi:DNA (cytosine-5)-methyltransferase 1
MRLNTLSAQVATTDGRNSYLDILGAAWQDHLKPREADAPTVISLFAGCGGSSLGYSMAGYRELAAVEWDENAIATFQLNFPDVPMFGGDICALSVDDLLDMAEIKPGQLDVLDGSPPCQGFSTAGKRIMDDPRNQLFREYVRILRGLRPKVFVMENVSGMVKGKMKLIFAEIVQELKVSGYRVSARLLNAMFFNVPQSRQRMIFIGVRDDLEIEPSHPRAEGRPFTVREALENVYLSNTDILETELTPLYQRYWHETRPGKTIGKLNQNLRLCFDKPSKTLQKGEGNGGVYHPDECRSLSEREMARLASFPDNFVFLGGKRNSKDRIGNSVPPLFMRSIARHIRIEILDKINGQ